VICNWNPVAVRVSTPNVGVNALPVIELIVLDVAVPVSKPVRVTVIWTVDAVPGLTFVTVINPVPLIVAEALCIELVADQVKEALKLVICNWNPVAVRVSTPNVGVNAFPVIELIEFDVAVPVSKPVRVTVIWTVDAVPGFTFVTVINPVPLIVAVALSKELVADHV
jgi:hypothetical protein